jgi:hypothetical protein
MRLSRLNAPQLSLAIILIFSFGAILFYSFQDSTKDPARAFLDSLSKEQLQKVQHDFNDLSREDWHFFPVAMLPRGGVSLKSLDRAQQSLLRPLLQHYLSESGYDKTMRIINLENVLSLLENNPKFRDAGLYHINFYGQPEDAVWAWSFEGHHVSLNFTDINGKISMVPRFLGANPAEVPSGPNKGERVLAAEEDLAFALLNALSPEQRQKAVFQEYSLWDLATSTSSQVGALKTVGIAHKALNKKQQTMLMAIVNEYVNTMPKPIAQERLQRIAEEDLNDIHFGWAGAMEKGKPHYYRIQGKTFLVEFDNTQNNANHIHTVWRDFDGDFGRDLIREHYKQHHKH